MHRVYHYLLSSPYQMVCTHRQTCPHTIERQCILHTKGFSLSFLKLPQNAPWAHLFIGWIGLFPLGTMWPSVCSHNSQDAARMVLWMENWAWAAAKQLPSRTDRLIKRAAKPEKNRRCCASFTVRENTAVLNSRDPLSKLAILRGKKTEDTTFPGGYDTSWSQAEPSELFPLQSLSLLWVDVKRKKPEDRTLDTNWEDGALCQEKSSNHTSLLQNSEKRNV